MVVSPLWLHTGLKILPTWIGFAQTPAVFAVYGVRITTCNLTTIVCGRWSLVTNWDVVDRRYA